MSASTPTSRQTIVRDICPPQGYTAPYGEGCFLAAVLHGHVILETPEEILPAGTGTLVCTARPVQLWSLDGGEICHTVLPCDVPDGLHVAAPAPAVFQEILQQMEALDSAEAPDRADLVTQVLALSAAPSEKVRHPADRENAVGRVISYVRNNLQGDLSLEALSKMASFSPYYFIRLFHLQTGITPGRFVSTVRLRKAAEMLDTTDHSVREVSRAVGYASDSMFCYAFKRIYGKTPGRYGNRIRQS